jgi:hypothetical protein
MQRVTTAWTVVVLDIDHHLDARQMRWKRSAVHAVPDGMTCSLGRSDGFTCRLAARSSLLDLFEPEQKLIFRQRLGAPAKAMAAQLPDDLFQPFGACPFRQQHRLQRAGIIGKRVCQSRHGSN